MPVLSCRVMADALAANYSLPIASLVNKSNVSVLPSDSSPDCFNDLSLPPSVAVGRWFYQSLAGSSELSTPNALPHVICAACHSISHACQTHDAVRHFPALHASSHAPVAADGSCCRLQCRRAPTR